MAPVLAHGTGDAFDLLVFLVGAVLTGAFLLTLRRMRALEASEQTRDATVTPPDGPLDDGSS